MSRNSWLRVYVVPLGGKAARFKQRLMSTMLAEFVLICRAGDIPTKASAEGECSRIGTRAGGQLRLERVGDRGGASIPSPRVGPAQKIQQESGPPQRGLGLGRENRCRRFMTCDGAGFRSPGRIRATCGPVPLGTLRNPAPSHLMKRRRHRFSADSPSSV